MTGQLPLLEWSPPVPMINFSGATYEPLLDYFRLNILLRNVRDCMLGEGWLSMKELQRRMLEKTGKEYGSGSLRARCADFRNKEQLQPYYISETKRERGGLFLYRLLVRE